MEKYTYSVVDQNGHVLAKDMEMDIAMTLIQALMNKWYNERELVLSLQRVYDEPCQGIDADEARRADEDRRRAASVVGDGEFYGEDC